MSREAMQMALEALEQYKGVVVTQPDPESFRLKDVDGGQAARAAIAALRAALAEPSPFEDVLVYGSAWSKDGKRIDPMSVFKEPEKNPFGDDAERYARKLREERESYKALFTAPTPRKPLTDEEILAEMPVAEHRPIISFARAIEEAVWKKNS